MFLYYDFHVSTQKYVLSFEYITLHGHWDKNISSEIKVTKFDISNIDLLYMCNITKPKKTTVRPVKIQISLGIRPIWSESLLSTQWVAKDSSFLHAYSKESD